MTTEVKRWLWWREEPGQEEERCGATKNSPHPSLTQHHPKSFCYKQRGRRRPAPERWSTRGVLRTGPPAGRLSPDPGVRSSRAAPRGPAGPAEPWTGVTVGGSSAEAWDGPSPQARGPGLRRQLVQAAEVRPGEAPASGALLAAVGGVHPRVSAAALLAASTSLLRGTQRR